uniref:Uncharacterized protein n=1 Tax=Sphaerodactylus townsendi TaxID=933632 RepID=A0ACB8E7S7_9SAUR
MPTQQIEKQAANPLHTNRLDNSTEEDLLLSFKTLPKLEQDAILNRMNDLMNKLQDLQDDDTRKSSSDPITQPDLINLDAPPMEAQDGVDRDLYVWQMKISSWDETLSMTT